MPSPVYPVEAIQLLTDLVKGRKENARLLASMGYPELALLYDGVNGNNGVVDILMKSKFVVLAAFLSAVTSENKGQVQFLLKNAPHWAATINFINKDLKAKAWLQKFNLGHYAILAEAIRKKLEDDEGSGLDILFRAPI